jgi:hypothetical protein
VILAVLHQRRSPSVCRTRVRAEGGSGLKALVHERRCAPAAHRQGTERAERGSGVDT